MKPVQHWCEQCRATTEHVEPRIAAMNTGKSRHTISNWMNQGLVHTLVLPSKRRLICSNSIFSSDKGQDAQKDVQKVKNVKGRRLTLRRKSAQNPNRSNRSID